MHFSSILSYLAKL